MKERSLTTVPLPQTDRPAELDRVSNPGVTEEESKGTKPPGSYLGTDNLTTDVARQNSVVRVPLRSGRLLKSTMHVLGVH